MGENKVKESIATMRRDLDNRRKAAADRFAVLVRRAQETEHLYGYTNPSRARINEVLASLFHKTPPQSNAPEIAKDKALAINDPV